MIKKSIVMLAGILVGQLGYGQGLDKRYSAFVKSADSLYNIKQYEQAARTYSQAFKTIGWKAVPSDRYNAACSWALASFPDSAFFHLQKLANNANYSNYGHLTVDPDLNALHDDARWNTLTQKVKENKEKAEANLNKPLVAILDSVFDEDQRYRLTIDQVEAKYGWQSSEMKALWKVIEQKDSVNLIKVKAIIDKHGWLGADVIGRQGNSTLFLVIQHADQATQEQYLPMMRQAVKDGKAEGSSLALLEDRVAIGQGKRQMYGSQIGRNAVTNKYFVSPLEDPDHVDKRRAEMGLGPLADYVAQWQIVWNVEQYKKDLPGLEQKNKKNTKAKKSKAKSQK